MKKIRTEKMKWSGHDRNKSALLWLTIEGAPRAIEVQFWLFAFGLPQARADAFASRCETRLKQIF